ncbi:helix-turn-helix protein [Archangium gephyra]|uniref:Helix-turn-helix protein n=1 Tax=Archangium gephyra TaxID=48 RepID=A0ABX9JK39_9BACT|nr:helix-turn-helix transcriptional regulator [Archangium gephyra]REG14182.1 helix-turn-helix protein [Archangium gephyra]
MIKNEREYRITQTQAAEFERSLAEVEQNPNPALHPRILQAQRDALSGQLEELRAELAEYDALRNGEKRVLELSSLEELPRALIEARIAAGLTQKDLAKRLGLSEQQIQRYESTDYSGASLSRLQEIVRALGINIRKEVFLPTVEVSPEALNRRLQTSGVASDFFTRRILGERDEDTGSVFALRAAGMLEKIFGWTPVELFTGLTPLTPQPARLGAQFKLPANADEQKTLIFTSYARFIISLALKASPFENRPLPRDAKDFQKEVLHEHGSINLTSVLSYLWKHGVPVVPLQESGGFHAACWRLSGRNAIVLKQKTPSESRWLHDLLHEAYHAAGSPDSPDFAFIEQGLGPMDRRESTEEQEATSFAADVLLNAKAEDMAKECVHEARGSIPRLKSAVIRVAERNKVSVGVLANYMAWRLSLQGEDWWGTATNLQETGEDPLKKTHQFLIEHLNWEKLDRVERELLMRAISEN